MVTKKQHMKSLLLILPETREADILLDQVRRFCVCNAYTFESSLSAYYRNEKVTEPVLVVTPTPQARLELVQAFDVSEDMIGDLERQIKGYKKIRQYLLDDPKTNQDDYFVQEYGPLNWMRRPTVDPDDIRRETGGKVVFTTPVHLLDDRVTVLDPEKRESERTYVVKDSSHPYRKFDGSPNRHCSKCPFPEGCVMCTLP